MTTLRTILLTTATVAALAVSGCGSAPEPVAADVPPPSSDEPTDGTGDDLLTTRGPVTVLDDGSGPELCLGAVAESYPPQCGGPPLEGWRWADYDGSFERASGVRWGQFAVTGTYDGSVMTLVEAVPAALVDPAPVDPPTPLPDPDRDLDRSELRAISREVSDELPGVLFWSVESGHVVVDVVHDDGSLQARADESYGGGVVVISSALVPAG